MKILDNKETGLEFSAFETSSPSLDRDGNPEDTTVHLWTLKLWIQGFQLNLASSSISENV